MDQPKPKYIAITLIFDEIDKTSNQQSLIDLTDCASVYMDKFPIFKETEIIGSAKKTLLRVEYTITVDYGPEGIEIEE